MRTGHLRYRGNRRGSAVIVVLAVVSIILIISMANVSRLSSLHSELRTLEKAQIKKLRQPLAKNRGTEKQREQSARH